MSLTDFLRRCGSAAHGRLSDGQLLARFAAGRDEAAFAALVGRHGPLVWGTCRRLLPDPADAEDAFQATFLVLLRRAPRLAERATVGPWLYRVAVWTARNLRRRNAYRLARGRPLPGAVADRGNGPAAADLRADLDAALLSLPEKYRTPVILCHLQGWTRRQAAAHLGCPEGTLSALLSRALGKLRRRLADRNPAVALAVAGAAPLPPRLAGAAVRAALVYASSSPGAAALSPVVASLTEGVLRMFWVKKLAAAALVLGAVLGAGLGVAVAVRPAPQALAQPPAPESPTAQRERIERELAALKARAEALEKQRAELAVREEAKHLADLLRKVGSEPYLEVQAAPDVEILMGLLRVTEYGPNGQKVGSLRCDNAAMLERFLSRTRKDPGGPRHLAITILPQTPLKRVREVLEACQAAGYPRAIFSGPIPQPGRTPALDLSRLLKEIESAPPLDVPYFEKYDLDLSAIDLDLFARPIGATR